MYSGDTGSNKFQSSLSLKPGIILISLELVEVLEQRLALCVISRSRRFFLDICEIGLSYIFFL
jgi:hypothetical protein